jgi:hypothetical protein
MSRSYTSSRPLHLHRCVMGLLYLLIFKELLTNIYRIRYTGKLVYLAEGAGVKLLQPGLCLQ